jgi:DNA helicase IV
LRARVVGLLQRQAEVRRAESPGEAWLRRMGRATPLARLLDSSWPVARPEGLVCQLLSDPVALAAAAAGILDESEQRLLLWPRPPRSARTARWSAADALLVDEVAGMVERPAGFGHLVVDEAQDLSAMLARALARRSGHGSLTLLGDLAQGTAAWAAGDWRETLAHLGKPEAAVVPLTTGFRVPADVVALANRLLPALGVDVPEAVSLRRDGALSLRAVPDPVAAAVAEAQAALDHEGSIGVIPADAHAGALRDALAAAGVDLAEVEDPGAAARVTVVPATLANGLEFDHVIVVEPAAIVAAEPRGLHRLYVVLTRAVTRLTVVHADPLPDPLAA